MAGGDEGRVPLVNVVSDREKKIAGRFTGDPVAAHRAACRPSREINAVTLPRRADIVLIDSHPADRDFWQSAKGVYAGTPAEARRLGFRHAATARGALEMAFERQGRGATVAVLMHGGRLLPLVEGEGRGDG